MTPEQMPSAEFDEARILRAGLRAVEAAIGTINRRAEETNAFHLLWNEKLKKYSYSIDDWAEMAGREVLKDELGTAIHVIGEETGEEAPPSNTLVGLLDMLDGSDLLARRLGNWCSALTLYRSGVHAKIFTAVVGTEDGRLYYVEPSQSAAYVEIPSIAGGMSRTKPLHVRTRQVGLRDASVAFYGQKPNKMLSIENHHALKMRLEQIAGEARDKKGARDIPMLRLYNLGGNPMMIALIGGQIDAIVEFDGQLCHDVVPGFIIALKAGAVLRDLDNNDITEARILKMLCNPTSRFKYVMANNAMLAEELICLSSCRM